MHMTSDLIQVGYIPSSYQKYDHICDSTTAHTTKLQLDLLLALRCYHDFNDQSLE